MFQTSVLASGSKGNCTIVRTENTAILVDTGLSYTRTCAAIKELQLLPQDLEAVIISHEHSDHIKGVGPLCRKLKIPVFITELTYKASSSKFGKIPSDIIFFKPGAFFTIGDLEVHAFPSSHDAVDACNFTITQKIRSSLSQNIVEKTVKPVKTQGDSFEVKSVGGVSRVDNVETMNKDINSPLSSIVQDEAGQRNETNEVIAHKDGQIKNVRKLALATDLGFCTKLLVNKIKDATTLILESNHDTNMLMGGRYPWHLKQRVRSINGHLSNDQAIGLLSQILHPSLDNIILAHLSEENNHPSIVEKVFQDYFTSIRCNTRFVISSQKMVTPLVDV